MSEAILTLQRQLGRFADELRRQTRRREKAEEGSDDARAAQQNIDLIKLKVADLTEALKTLGAG